MIDSEFIDYYEILEVSSNANTETIERIFRFLATRYHPDINGTGDLARFNQMVEAYKALTDPESRAAYDIQYRQHQQHQADLITDSEAAGPDCVDQYRVLTLFYAQRKRDMKSPGVGPMKLAQILGCPLEVIDFYVWYFREKGWVKREENGLLAISAAGVDEINSHNQELMSNDRFITDQSHDCDDPSEQAGDQADERVALAQTMG